MTRKSNRERAVHTDSSPARYFELFLASRRFGPTRLDRYIFNEILIPFVVALLFWTTLFVSVVLKDVVGELLGKGIELTKIIQYLGYLVGEKVTETIPMASLFAGIMAAGRLSGDSEIAAMRSAGISFPRIYSVFLFAGFLSMLVVGYMNLFLGPHNARERENFEIWLRSYHSLTLVRPGAFLGRADMDGVSKTGQDIYSAERVGEQLQIVQIREWFNDIDDDNPNTIMVQGVRVPIGDGFLTQVIHARTGEMLTRHNDDGSEDRIIRLTDGFIFEQDEKRSGYQITNFLDGQMDYEIPSPAQPLGRLDVRPENYTFPELFAFIRKIEEGGIELDPCLLLNICGAEAQRLAGMEEMKSFVLPGAEELEREIMRLRIWLATNHGKVGQPDGPTQEEFQNNVRLSVMLATFEKDAERTRRRFEVEIQRRLAIPVASLLFFFISFPLGLVVKRSGKGMGFGVALLVFAVYYLVLSFGLTQAYAGQAPPVAGAWLANLVIFIMALHIMSRRTDGFAPFHFLGAPFRFVGRLLARLLRPLTEPLVFRFAPPLERLYAPWRARRERTLERLLDLRESGVDFFQRRILRRGGRE